MKVPHSRPTIGQDDIDAVKEVLTSGMIAQGIKVKEFEEAFARFIGRRHAVACTSGTSALHLALLCLDIATGDEVILPSYVCSSPYIACLHAGAVPRVADIGTAGFNISSENINIQKSDKTKAVIVPHMFGTPAELDEIGAEGISIVEDCAQSVGAEYRGKMVGAYGDVSIFSFYATKMFTTGEGGMLLTDNQEVCEHAKELRAYDMKSLSPPKYNYKMTDIQAAMGISQLRKLEKFIDIRKEQASLYSEALGEFDIGLPGTDSHMNPVHYRYVISIDDPERVRDFAKKEGVTCERPVFQPLHRSL
jgi:perosamine synthetase